MNRSEPDRVPVYNRRRALVGYIERKAFPPMLVFNFKTLAIGDRLVMVALERGDNNEIARVIVERSSDLHGHEAFTLA